MDTTHTRTKFVRAAVLAGTAATALRSRQILIVLALALVILLVLSAPVVHAAPEDGTGSEPVDDTSSESPFQPLQVHASENPVVFLPSETTKTITLTLTPPPEPKVLVEVQEDGDPMLVTFVDKGSGPLDLTVTLGKVYTVWVGPAFSRTLMLTITTKQAEALPVPQPVPLPLPQPPGINLPLIPRLPDLALPTS